MSSENSKIQDKTLNEPIRISSGGIYNTEHVYGLREVEFIKLSQPNWFLYTLGSTFSTAGISQVIENFSNESSSKGFALSVGFFINSQNIIWTGFTAVGLLMLYLATKLSWEKKRINDEISEHFKKNRRKRLTGEAE
ncbi:hypothetical protein DAERI_040085 [Deinococcus aerius]|uniref:Uncharacterized protein n=1 Tax=Deinococcus aerius TaxID=200253 RepID=A0A2I9DXB5_9DEIO|nr:hypothetical protein [Deinococcus aerius]GBF05325.1 hypothetical protein DAERI_040085 [Deinococcus aerius]